MTAELTPNTPITQENVALLKAGDVKARIEAKVEYDPFGGCWLWTGAQINSGYGHIKVRGRMVLAHRQSYEEAHGPIPDGHVVRHRCDVRVCVNPDHLECGTHLENMADFKQRGQMPDRDWMPKPKRRQIARLLRTGMPASEVARQCGVARGTVRYYQKDTAYG